MKAALLLTTFLWAAPSLGQARRGTPPKLELGQKEFARGDFQGALKALEQAAHETSDLLVLSRIHLLRGQSYAALQDFARAEAAFAEALEADPEASLDPSKVDPNVVKMLDGLRARLKGELIVRAAPPVVVTVDGREIGQTPARAQLSVGRHLVEGRTSDGRWAGRQYAVVRSNRDTELELLLVELPVVEVPRYEGTTPRESPRRPFGDLRLGADPFALTDTLGPEVGGGFEFPFWRVSLHARVAQPFALTPRGALVVPVTDRLNGSVELELPVAFIENGPGLSLGGGGGVEYVVSKWLGAFAQVGARHRFLPAGGNQDSVVLQLGVRLRLP